MFQSFPTLRPSDLTTTYPAFKMFELLTAIAIFAALLGVLTRTRVGLIIQAALTHPNMVAMLGHNVPRVFMLVFGVGTGLAAVAGVIAGPALVTQSNMAGLIGLIQTFAVSVNVSLADLFAAVGITLGPDNMLSDIWQVPVAQVAPVIPY